MDINNWFFHRHIEIDCLFFSVADPGCLSRIPEPDFYPSRIPDLGSRITDPKTVTKERGEKNLLSFVFFSQKISQNWILCYFWNAKEKNLVQFSKNCWSFYKKIFNVLSNIWVRDPRSGIRKKPIPDPGSRCQKGTGSRIRICSTAFLKYWSDCHLGAITATTRCGGRGRAWQGRGLAWRAGGEGDGEGGKYKG